MGIEIEIKSVTATCDVCGEIIPVSIETTTQLRDGSCPHGMNYTVGTIVETTILNDSFHCEVVDNKLLCSACSNARRHELTRIERAYEIEKKNVFKIVAEKRKPELTKQPIETESKV